MRLVCPYCGRTGDARPKELIGRLYRCLTCGKVFVWEDALCPPGGQDCPAGGVWEPQG